MHGRGRFWSGGGKGKGGGKGGGKGSEVPICRQFLRTGKCDRGGITGQDRCNFAHVLPQHNNERDTLPELRVCFDFANKGACQFGQNCKFRHIDKSRDNPDSNAFHAAKAWAYANAERDQKRRKGAASSSSSSSAGAPADGLFSLRRPVADARPQLPSCLAKVQRVEGSQRHPRGSRR